MIIAHRGHTAKGGENTLTSFNNALAAGAQALECDLRLTKDNKIVLYHANSLFGALRKTDVLQNPDLVTIDDLFSYIKQTDVPFFLEVKTSSPILIEEIVKRTDLHDLWDRVHVMGYSFYIHTALRMQGKYSKLRVLQFLTNPLLPYLMKPKKGYGVCIGWFDQWYGTQTLFRAVLPTKRLRKLREFYESQGFIVMAGVINGEDAMRYFMSAGIEHFVTDTVPEALRVMRA